MNKSPRSDALRNKMQKEMKKERATAARSLPKTALMKSQRRNIMKHMKGEEAL